MDNQTYALLQDYLPEDCILIINEYCKDFLRNELNFAFRQVYPYELEIWKESNVFNDRVNYCSRMMLYHPHLHRQFVSVVRTYRPVELDRKWRDPHVIDKYLYVYNCQHRISTRPYWCLNKVNHILEYMNRSKTELQLLCFDNDVRYYMSWSKKRLIQALLKI